MRTYTQEFTVYTVEELRDKFPDGFAHAHARYIEDAWNIGWAHDTVRHYLDMAEEDESSPLTGRFIEWSTYPGWARYEDGQLSSHEAAGLVDKFPPLDRATVWLEGGTFRADTYRAFDEDAADDALKAANKWLSEFTDRLYAAVLDAERAVESVDEFIGHAEANEYEFHEDGRLA